MQSQGPAGAHTRAEAAIDAKLGIDADLGRGPIERKPLAFQPGLRRGQLIDITRQLHHHGAALVGRDLGLENLGGNVKVHRQPIGDRLVHRLAGEMEDEAPFHREAPLPWPQR